MLDVPATRPSKTEPIASSPLADLSTADPNEATVDGDRIADPELDRRDLGELILFGRFLAPPQRKPFNDAALRGELLFEELGCVKCHIPSLPSSRGPVDAYTDLLIHHMGEDLEDNIRLGDVSASLTDFRTQPLWGISLFPPYLHDGRAPTLMDAIDLHGGEAQAIRDAFTGLEPDEQADVITFLEHL